LKKKVQKRNIKNGIHWCSTLKAVTTVMKKRGEDPDVIYFDNQELLEWSIVPIGST
jgi:hypothetical protein